MWNDSICYSLTLSSHESTVVYFGNCSYFEKWFFTDANADNVTFVLIKTSWVFQIQKDVESAADLEAATLQVQKSQIAVDTEQELAKAEMVMHAETLKDTAPVLEGIKVIWINVHFHTF